VRRLTAGCCRRRALFLRCALLLRHRASCICCSLMTEAAAASLRTAALCCPPPSLLPPSPSSTPASIARCDCSCFLYFSTVMRYCFLAQQLCSPNAGACCRGHRSCAARRRPTSEQPFTCHVRAPHGLQIDPDSSCSADAHVTVRAPSTPRAHACSTFALSRHRHQAPHRSPACPPTTCARKWRQAVQCSSQFSTPRARLPLLLRARCMRCFVPGCCRQ
jgi:hypothetical protein